MILDHAIDVEAIKRLPEAERIKLVQQAFAEFVQIVNSAKENETDILKTALSHTEQTQIDALRELIKALPNS